jgi:putative ABC transport system permease protein
MPVIDRIRRLFRRTRLDDEIRMEMDTHIAMRTEHNREHGQDAALAEIEARRQFGNRLRIQEDTRAVHFSTRLEAVWTEFRYAAGNLRRSPGFSFSAIVTLALGIGAATVIFSVANGILIQPLPYPNSNRLVMVWRVLHRFQMRRAPASYPDFLDWSRRTKSFDGIAAFTGTSATLSDQGDPERLTGARVSGNLFSTLGINLAMGRPIQGVDDRIDADSVVLISNNLWTRRFGRDPAVVGTRIMLGEERRLVIGVVPAGLEFPSSSVQFWIPLRLNPATVERDSNFLQVIGRLSPGTTLSAAQTELRSIAFGVTQENGNVNPMDDLWLENRQEYLVGGARPALYALSGAVLLLVLLASANFINLLLVRTTTRRRELAVRAALGASAGRLRQGLLAESLVLASVGGCLGMLIAWVAAGLLTRSDLFEFVRKDQIAIDYPVFLFTAVLSLGSAIVCGWLPAVRASRGAPGATLRDGGSGTRGPAAMRIQSALVVLQVAVAVVLLIGAGVLGRSFYRLISVRTGFDADRVLTAQIVLPLPRYDAEERRTAFYTQVMDKLQSVPGVEAVGATWAMPFSPDSASSRYFPEGADPSAETTVRLTPIRGDFFRAMGITRIAGRDFNAFDGRDSADVAIVNETLALRFWPGQDPIGKRLVKFNDEHRGMTVIGVAADLKQASLDEEPAPEAYLPQAQSSWARDMYFALRTSGEPMAMAPALHRAVLDVDPSLPLIRVSPLARMVSNSVSEPRFRTAIFVSLALVAGALALVGVYGILSFVVVNGKREMAIRMALGAQHRDLQKDVIRRAFKLALAGAILGTLCAFAETQALRRFLFGVTALDPATFAVVPALLLLATVFAAWAPARRARAVDPMQTLRQQ